MQKQEFISQLKKFVSFKTLAGSETEMAKALDFVESKLSNKTSIKRVKNGKAEILVAGNTASMSPDVGYMVHMDIVAGKPEQFTLKQKGDKLFGRGASDMKFSVPMGIGILNELIANKSKITFCLAITTDEEIGGPEGAAFLAGKMKFRPKCLIVPDGGDNLVFVNKAKGVCWLKVFSKGSPAHASRPWKGKNALDPIVKLATELVKIYGKNSLKENWNTTMNIGQINGGISTNQVCPEATMNLDFRYPKGDSIEKIFNKVKNLAKKISSNLKVEIDSTTLPTFTDESLPVVKSFVNSMAKAYGKKINIAPTYGASDASHFADFNIPILMMKPMGGEIHSDNEWVSLSSSMKFYEGLKLFIDSYYTNSS